MARYSVIGIGEHHKFFDAKSYSVAIHYISNPSHACCVGGANISSLETAAVEMQANAAKFQKDSGKRIRHSVLSFETYENITVEKANSFAQKIIQYYAPDYQIVYAVHDNTEHVHIHFVMNQISLTGTRYAGKKKDYYDFQAYMKAVTKLPIILTRDTNRAD